MSNDTDIAVLQEQVKVMNNLITDLVEANQNTLTQLATFNTTIKTGKWLFVTFLLSMGALGHKGYDLIAKFFTGQ